MERPTEPRTEEIVPADRARKALSKGPLTQEQATEGTARLGARAPTFTLIDAMQPELGYERAARQGVLRRSPSVKVGAAR
jgi:hypothetical protein